MNGRELEELRGFDYRSYYQERLDSFSVNGKEATACCPFHGDTNPSFSVNCDKGLFHCHACKTGGNLVQFHMKMHDVSYQDAVEMLLEIKDNYLDKRIQNVEETSMPINDGSAALRMRYDYSDESGEYAFSVLRIQSPGKKKTFRQGRYDEASSRWDYSVKGLPTYPYRLPTLLSAETVYVVEGEKDADNLAKLGLAATCNPGGANKWKSEYGEYFRGKDVIILPDNDAPGQRHAEDVRDKLISHAASVRIVQLPELPEKGDVSDWLEAGGTTEQLQALVEGTCAEIAPPVPFSFKSLDLASLRAGRFLASHPKKPKWTLIDSLMQGTLGFVVSNGGVGKSMFLQQLAISVATDLDCIQGLFQIGERGKVFAVFAEDTDDNIHHRMNAIVWEYCNSNSISINGRREIIDQCNENLFVMSGIGIDLRLQEESRKSLIITQTFKELKDKVRSIKDLKLIILDPASRFYGTNENDNSQATHFCSLLESIGRETGATILMSHHTNKMATQAGDGGNSLSQGAIRGASGFTNAARWQLNLSTLKEKDMAKLGEDPAQHLNYLMGAVVKKNYGKPEPKFLMRRARYGVLKAYEDNSRAISRSSVLKKKILELVGASEDSQKRVTKTSFVKQYKSQLDATNREIQDHIAELIKAGKLKVVTAKNGKGRSTEYLTVIREQE